MRCVVIRAEGGTKYRKVPGFNRMSDIFIPYIFNSTLTLLESDPCGGPREKCCFDKEDYCKSSDLACDFGGSRECVECAGSGQDCDDNTPCCSENEACGRTGKCTACGGELQPCCETESQGLKIVLLREDGDASSDLECNSGLTCDYDFDVCVSCGGFAELCCNANLPENECKESTETCNDSEMGATFKCEVSATDYN